MESMSIKLPRSLSARVARLAKQRNVSRTTIVRDALEAYTTEKGGSAGGAVSDLMGCLKGLPRDLSTHPRHLKGYGG
jgi:metal-responsive CopG/Arc/MetJ family transcriptional regulator